MGILRFGWEGIIGMGICWVSVDRVVCMMRMEIMKNMVCVVWVVMVVISSILRVNSMIWKKVRVY